MIMNMLYITFKENNDRLAPDIYFNHVYERDWFDNDTVKRIVEIIDNRTIMSGCIYEV